MSSYIDPKPWTYVFRVEEVREKLADGTVKLCDDHGYIICRIGEKHSFLFSADEDTLGEYMGNHTEDEIAADITDRLNNFYGAKRNSDLDCIASVLIPSDRFVSMNARKRLEEIAMSCDYYLLRREGIHVIGNDTEDNPEINIVRLQEMLERAYLYGVQEGKKK